MRSVLALALLGISLAISGMPSASFAGGLSGQKGKMRYSFDFTYASDCEKLYRRYIKANGHSAFAATAASGWSESICAIGLNLRTQEAAEKSAVKSCKQGLKQYRGNFVGACEVYMSK